MYDFTDEEILVSQSIPGNINEMAVRLSMDLQRVVDEQLMRFVEVRNIKSSNIIDVRIVKLPQHLKYTEELAYHVSYQKGINVVTEPVLSTSINPDMTTTVRILYED